MTKIKTSQKILNCATRLFAQHGYDGTIMDDLAEQCDVNKASIYYHHKDKATLYENALTALFTPIADAVIEAVKKGAVEVVTSPLSLMQMGMIYNKVCLNYTAKKFGTACFYYLSFLQS
mgnify:CR=1 FL=1